MLSADLASLSERRSRPDTSGSSLEISVAKETLDRMIPTVSEAGSIDYIRQLERSRPSSKVSIVWERVWGTCRHP